MVAPVADQLPRVWGRLDRKPRLRVATTSSP